MILLDQESKVQQVLLLRLRAKFYFQRLLMGVRMPDGSFALVSVVDRAEKMAVSGVDQRWIDDMPADATVDF